MPASIIDGKAETAHILFEVASGVTELQRLGKKACLAAVQANDDAGSIWYAKAQAKHCEEHGIDYRLIKRSAVSSTQAIQEELRILSQDPEVSGIILLTPLPPGVDYLTLVQSINPLKDAEGVHPANMGRLLVSTQVNPAPCTAMAALTLIKSVRPELSGARALVIGRSATVGKPLGLLLLAEHATVTIAHTRSDLRACMLEAEVVVAAAGASGARWKVYEKKLQAWKDGQAERPDRPSLEPLVTMDMVRRGAVVIDVGDNYIPVALDINGEATLDGKGRPAMRYAGDVDFDKVREVAGYITNTRGSVGPLTNAFLLLNVVRGALGLAGVAGK